MSIQELEQQLLSLDRAERMRLVQILTQSLVSSTDTESDQSRNVSMPQSDISVVEFFRNSPLMCRR